MSNQVFLGPKHPSSRQKLVAARRSMLARRMRLDVLDRDRSSISGDDACGWAYANLDLVAEGQVTEQWVQLRGVPSGELRIRFLVLSGTDDSLEVWPLHCNLGMLGRGLFLLWDICD
jgi:hypothetical protein